MKEKVKKGDLYYYELLDRISIIQHNIEDFVLKNPACKKHSKITKKVEKVQDILAEVYANFSKYY